VLNWIEYCKELMGRIGEFGAISPETVKGYQTLSKAGEKTGHLDAKTRELIALAVAVTARCDGCVTVHVAEPVKLGASKGEIAEALGVAVALNAGAAMVYSARAIDALKAHSGAGSPAAAA
jgi:AhpD family alkylhydroperoxidase